MMFFKPAGGHELEGRTGVWSGETPLSFTFEAWNATALSGPVIIRVSCSSHTAPGSGENFRTLLAQHPLGAPYDRGSFSGRKTVAIRDFLRTVNCPDDAGSSATLSAKR